MANLVTWLNGKKGYITATLYGVIALVEFLAKGDFSTAAILTLAKSESLATFGVALRAGVAKLKKS